MNESMESVNAIMFHLNNIAHYWRVERAKLNAHWESDPGHTKTVEQTVMLAKQVQEHTAKTYSEDRMKCVPSRRSMYSDVSDGEPTLTPLGATADAVGDRKLGQLQKRLDKRAEDGNVLTEEQWEELQKEAAKQPTRVQADRAVRDGLTLRDRRLKVCLLSTQSQQQTKMIAEISRSGHSTAIPTYVGVLPYPSSMV